MLEFYGKIFACIPPFTVYALTLCKRKRKYTKKFFPVIGTRSIKHSESPKATRAPIPFLNTEAAFCTETGPVDTGSVFVLYSD